MTSKRIVAAEAARKQPLVEILCLLPERLGDRGLHWAEFAKLPTAAGEALASWRGWEERCTSASLPLVF